ncbi:MAG: osmotically inducible protein C [Candidatus Aminicenantes bacterium]|nr:osmotically inducible protein C [Candidatus Aminicenantes bacterium]
MNDEIKLTFPGGKRVNAEVKGFTIETDQPVYQGGEGSSPAPFDLFLASIATCSGIYLLSFCQSRKISTEELGLVMTKEIDKDKKMIKKIIIKIQLPPDFPKKYHRAVVSAVSQCSVKRHMVDPPEFQFMLNDQ